QQSNNPTTPLLHSSNSFSLHAPIWLPQEWDFTLHRRQGALFLNQGYPLTLDEEFEFTLPANAQVGALPPFSENQSGPLRWRIEWAKDENGNLGLQFRAELPRGELSAAETPVFQTQLRSI